MAGPYRRRALNSAPHGRKRRRSKTRSRAGKDHGFFRLDVPRIESFEPARGGPQQLGIVRAKRMLLDPAAIEPLDLCVQLSCLAMFAFETG